MPSEHPILFSGQMVRAILEGRKTQTRRIVRLDGKGRCSSDCSGAEPERARVNRGFDGPNEYLSVPCKDGAEQRVYSSYGEPGDLLWVRETWGEEEDEHGCTHIIFAADGEARLVGRSGDDGPNELLDGKCSATGKPDRWRPSIFMPRWASRITLEMTDVRVQRLQDITEDDARAEGVAPLQMDGGSYLPTFEGLWDSINGKRAPWKRNPWVWAITFRVASATAKETKRSA